MLLHTSLAAATLLDITTHLRMSAHTQNAHGLHQTSSLSSTRSAIQRTQHYEQLQKARESIPQITSQIILHACRCWIWATTLSVEGSQSLASHPCVHLCSMAISSQALKVLHTLSCKLSCSQHTAAGYMAWFLIHASQMPPGYHLSHAYAHPHGIQSPPQTASGTEEHTTLYF